MCVGEVTGVGGGGEGNLAGLSDCAGSFGNGLIATLRHPAGNGDCGGDDGIRVRHSGVSPISSACPACSGSPLGCTGVANMSS